MYSILIDNNRYNLVNFKIEQDQKFIFWVWGKTDFLSFYKMINNQWQLQQVFLVKHNKKYSFLGVSGHGQMFEELKWGNADDTIYIELPLNFASVMKQVSQEFNDFLK